MFNPRHYVPILRWKRGEKWALRNLEGEIRAGMTPLMELIPRDFTPRRIGDSDGCVKKLNEIARQILESWGEKPFFVDMCHVHSVIPFVRGVDSFQVFGEIMSGYQLKPIPVTGLRRPLNYQSSVTLVAAAIGEGACVRLNSEDLRNPTLHQDLSRLVSLLHLEVSGIHLIIDNQLIDSHTPSLPWICSHVPDLNDWKTFTLAGGAFPKDLSDLEKNRQHELPRTDWLTWRDQVSTGPMPLRLPAYGDYTIQHPFYSEPPPNFNISASIRYTSERTWVVMRGEGVRNDDGPGYRGYLGNAQLLICRTEYCGDGFSAGDCYIMEMSLQDEKTGSAETWIRAGINHHLTFVVRQISSLFDSAAVVAP